MPSKPRTPEQQTAERQQQRVRRTNDLVKNAAAIVEGERRCRANKSNGEPCPKFAIKGGMVCDSHGGRAPQVKARAQKRLLALVEPSIVRLNELIHQDGHLPTALGAIRTVLERAGDEAIGPLKKVAEQADMRPVINIGIKVGGIEKPLIRVGMQPQPDADIDADILEAEVVGDDNDPD